MIFILQKERAHWGKGMPDPRSFTVVKCILCRPPSSRPTSLWFDYHPDNDLQYTSLTSLPPKRRTCSVCTLCNVCASVEILRKQTEEVCQSKWWIINPDLSGQKQIFCILQFIHIFFVVVRSEKFKEPNYSDISNAVVVLAKMAVLIGLESVTE